MKNDVDAGASVTQSRAGQIIAGDALGIGGRRGGTAAAAHEAADAHSARE